MNRRHRDLLRSAKAVCACAVVEQTSGGHYRVRLIGPTGTRTLVTARTPSDRRGEKNFAADLRRLAREIGLEVR